MSHITHLLLSIPIGIVLLFAWTIIFFLVQLFILSDWKAPIICTLIFLVFVYGWYSGISLLSLRAKMGFIAGLFIGSLGILACITWVVSKLGVWFYNLVFRTFKIKPLLGLDSFTLELCTGPGLLASTTLLTIELFLVKQHWYLAIPPMILLLLIGPILTWTILKPKS
jgi:hypothetical protein